MENLAITIPEKIPASSSKGVHRAFLGLHKLPDDYLVYYEPLIDRRRPDFIIIGPDVGLMAIEVRNWYPGMITGISDQEIHIEDGETSRIEVNPIFHVRQYLSVITRRITDNPVFSSLLISGDDKGNCLCFPTSHVVLLPNCTIPQLTHHQLGDLHSFFDPDHTICREVLHEIEQWDPEELIPFLRSLASSKESTSPLAPEQIHLLRAVIHPDIIIDQSFLKGTTLHPHIGSSALKILDYHQEKKVYLIRQGHQIVAGAAGSGKTTILAARARILHHHAESRILVLCNNTVLCEQFRRMFTGYPRIHAYSFGEWGSKLGIEWKSEEGEESDQEYGTRLLKAMQTSGSESHAYDAVLIDEAQDFSPSWFLCAREAMKDPDEGDLLIVSDGHQGQCGPGGISWKELGIHTRGRINHQLHDLGYNYRNTKEILALARLFLRPGSDEMDCPPEVLSRGQSYPSRTGLKPLLVWNTSHVNQCEYAAFLVRRLLGSLKSAQYLSGLKPEDIGIIYPYAEDQDRKALDMMISDLGRFCPVQWISENNYTHSRIHLPGVKVHDSHSIKGMQYRAVMVLFSEYYDKYLHHPRYAADRHLLYVALTRPADFLTIQYTEKTDLIRKILSSGNIDEFIGK